MELTFYQLMQLNPSADPILSQFYPFHTFPQYFFEYCSITHDIVFQIMGNLLLNFSYQNSLCFSHFYQPLLVSQQFYPPLFCHFKKIA